MYKRKRSITLDSPFRNQEKNGKLRHSYVATNSRVWGELRYTDFSSFSLLGKVKLFNLLMQITLCGKQNFYRKTHNNSRVRVLQACGFVTRARI